MEGHLGGWKPCSLTARGDTWMKPRERMRSCATLCLG